MIDLIDECGADLSAYGYTVQKLDKYASEVARMHVKSKKQSEELGFDKGDYVIVNSPLVYQLDNDCHEYISSILQSSVKQMFDELAIHVKEDRFLIIGIGNPDILADSLGKCVIDNIPIDVFNENSNVFKLCPNIYLNTGISTNEIVHIMAAALNVDCVILIDSLATRQVSRLGISFQVNSAGITPGSATNCKNKKIDNNSLGIPCISFGVPFMIFASDLDKKANKDLILTSKDIQENVQIASKIIAKALCGALNIK